MKLLKMETKKFEVLFQTFIGNKIEIEKIP